MTKKCICFTYYTGTSAQNPNNGETQKIPHSKMRVVGPFPTQSCRILSTRKFPQPHLRKTTFQRLSFLSLSLSRLLLYKDHTILTHQTQNNNLHIYITMEDRHTISVPRIKVPNEEMALVWLVDIYRKGVSDPIDTLDITEETLPPRTNKRGKIVWRLPKDPEKLVSR